MLIRLLREAPSWRKLEMVDQLNQAVKLLALAGLRQRYPRENEERFQRRLADLLLGGDLACKAYGALRRGLTLLPESVSVLMVQAERLGRDYFRKWAVELEVGDLLQRDLKETGVE